MALERIKITVDETKIRMHGSRNLEFFLRGMGRWICFGFFVVVGVFQDLFLSGFFTEKNPVIEMVQMAGGPAAAKRVHLLYG